MNSSPLHTIPPATKQQVQSLAVKGDIVPALELLRAISSHEAIANNLLLRYRAIDTEAQRGLITTESAEVAINNVAQAIFELLSEKELSLSQTLSSLLPALPPNYLVRDEFVVIENALLLQSERFYGISGIEGTGKTSLAVAIAHSKKIQLAFEGAVFWVGVGEKIQKQFLDTSPVPYQEQLYLQLQSGETIPGFKNWQHALIVLQKLAHEKLNNKKCLIIVDVQSVDQLLEAVDIHENAVFLVITSDESKLRAKGIKDPATFRIGGLNELQALQLLSAWSEQPLRDHAAYATEIVAKLGFHPLAIAMAGASIKGAIDARAAWSDVVDAIKECALDEFSYGNQDDLHSLFKLSFERLNEEERSRFYFLSIFPEGWQFSMESLLLIWNGDAERKVRRLLLNLVDKALLQQTGENLFALHNLPRLYMRTQLRDALPVFCNVVPRLFPSKTVLIVAVAWDDAPMVELLLNNKAADINEENIDGLIPLQVAAIQGNAVMLRLLLKHGADLNQQNKYSKTALMLAAAFGQTHIAEILIKSGAAVNLADNFKFTALHAAAEAGCLEIVRLLLENGADPVIADEQQRSPLYHAADMGHTDIINLLLRYRPLADHLTHPLITPLSMAVMGGHIEAIKALLAAGEDINFRSPADGTTVLHFAAESGHVDMINFLVQSGADPDVGDLQLLTPLHRAIRVKQNASAEALIKNGANVNARTTINMTPLHSAAGNLNEEVVAMLLNAHADVNSIMSEGYAPLQTALHYRGTKLLSTLSGPAGSNVEEHSSITPFTEGISIIELLLKSGADTEVRLDNRLYSLHIAIWHADVESVKLLIEAGASRQVRTADDKSLPDFLARILKQPLLPSVKERLEMIRDIITA